MEYLKANPKGIKTSGGLPFYWTYKLLKKDMAKNVSLFYAFYQHAKELSQFPTKLALESIGKLDQELDSPTHTFMIRLIESMESLGIKVEVAREILNCARFDVGKKHIYDHDELLAYCENSAGALGAMVAPAMGAKSSKILPCATDLGIGAGLLRMCSNILADAKKGRVYLPKKELDIMRLNHKELSQMGDTPVELKKIVEKYLDLAEAYLMSSKSGLTYLPLRGRVGMVLAINGCQEMAAKIRRHDFEVLEGDFQLSFINKLFISYRTAWDLLRPSFWTAISSNRGEIKRAATAR